MQRVPIKIATGILAWALAALLAVLPAAVPPALVGAVTAAGAAAPDGPPQDEMLGRIAIWRSFSQDSHKTADNPGGLSQSLRDHGPEALVDLCIEAVDDASNVIGYAPEVIIWGGFGNYLEDVPGDPRKQTLAFDAYVAGVESRVGQIEKLGSELRRLRGKTPRTWLYYGSPLAWVGDEKDDHRWAEALEPAIAGRCGVILDAQATVYTLQCNKAVALIRACGLPVGVEPWAGRGSRWVAERVPCFVMLQTVRAIAKSNFSPSYNAERNPPGGVYVLVGDHTFIEPAEVRKYLLEGKTVVMPFDTPTAKLAECAK